MQKVTIAPSSTEALIRQKVDAAPATRDFLPEKQIFDVEVLRRDYEKLRIAHELGALDRPRARTSSCCSSRSSSRRSSCCRPIAASSC